MSRPHASNHPPGDNWIGWWVILLLCLTDAIGWVIVAVAVFG